MGEGCGVKSLSLSLPNLLVSSLEKVDLGFPGGVFRVPSWRRSGNRQEVIL